MKKYIVLLSMGLLGGSGCLFAASTVASAVGISRDAAAKMQQQAVLKVSAQNAGALAKLYKKYPAFKKLADNVRKETEQALSLAARHVDCANFPQFAEGTLIGIMQNTGTDKQKIDSLLCLYVCLGLEDEVKKRVAGGASLEEVLYQEMGRRPLIAALYAQGDFIEKLSLQGWANMLEEDKEFFTRNLNIIDYLLDHGALVQVSDADRGTPLQIADQSYAQLQKMGAAPEILTRYQQIISKMRALAGQQRSSGRQTGSARRAAKRKQAAGAAAQAQQHNAASVPTAPPVSLVTPLVALAALPSTSTHVVSPACAQNDGPSRMVQEQSRALAGAGSSTAVLDLLNKQVGSQEVIKQNRNNDSGSRVQDDFDFLNDVADKKTHAYQSTVLSRDQTIESTVSMLTKKASLYARFEKFRKMAEDSVGELSAEVDPIPPFLKDFLFWVRQRIFPRTYGSNA